MSKKSDNFFYRIDAAPFLAAVIKTPESERGAWVLEMALHLATGIGSNAFASQLMDEANAYRKVKSDAGKKGMENRYKKDNTG